MPQVGLVVLAAGESRRMGTPKQALPFRGKSLLAHAVETAEGSRCSSVVVMLGAYADDLEPLIGSENAHIIRIENWLEGMNVSIREGIRFLSEGDELDAAILMTCDQPYLTSELLNQLIEIYEETRKPIVSCTYAGAVGVPTLFDRSLFPGLMRLPPGAGAKKLIASLPTEQIAPISFPNGAIDLDTPEDYENLIG